MDEVIKAGLMKTLKFTIEFLDAHKLYWFVCGGTAIGAIRHQGFIPWDDDIDLLMPRADYNKLLSLKSDIESHGYGLVSPGDNHYAACFSKIVDMHSTIWEHEKLPIILGLYVDIYPYDNSDEDKDSIVMRIKEFKKMARRYYSCMTEYKLSYFVERLIHFHPISVIHALQDITIKLLTSKDFYHNFLEMNNQLNDADGRYAVVYTGESLKNEIYPRSLFDSVISMPFEDIFVNVPVGYHQYLTDLYGDYMTLPSAEKRISHHSRYYINFNERLSIEQIREIKNQRKASIKLFY